MIKVSGWTERDDHLLTEMTGVKILRKIIEACPTCGGQLTIRQVQCVRCQTVVESEYTACEFCRLTPASTEFLRVFVRVRGNIKEIERELRIPYSQARSRLKALLEELGYDPEVERILGRHPAPRAVVEALADGDISLEHASSYLNGGKGNESREGQEV